LIEKYPYKDWDWDYLSENPNTPIEIIKYMPKHPHLVHNLLTRSDILSIIEKLPHKMRYRNVVPNTPNITIEIIKKSNDKGSSYC
jgi:hypothetical protein